MNWWETDFVSVRDNRLIIAGRDATALAERYGTPLYVYGKDRILDRYGRLDDAFTRYSALPGRISYAMKANPHMGILRLLQRRGAWIDAVSPCEVETALKAGFPAERILFTGTSVSRADLRFLFGVEGLTINIDAPEQLDLMSEVRNGFPGRAIRVSVRWNSGIGRGFNPKAITAGKRSSDGTPIKFGVEPRKVVDVFARARKLGFQPVGLHQHIGSGWVREDYGMVLTAVDRMIRKAREIEKAGFRLEFLDFGGGFGPRYLKSRGLFPVEDYIAYISRAVAKAGLSVKALVIEPGKFMVSDAGVLLLGVEYVKESYGNLFACVDGGTFNTVPRPAIYVSAHHEIVNASRVDGPHKARLTVAGNLCETGDVFGRERLMPLPQSGDVLAVLLAGAYCRSMASHYNLRPIPREVLI
ncbi:MAG TPA: diaminopimelate decarboxylase [Candidatus Aminicenantes bacterium]|nr:diaminopimelate decarboxylase [Candidatus Aminicenantes bacterium]HRY66003.1 diaminopimelate decarboxylase [Candidatus Aminicenantes bacterium]HRZ72948.1 diaminopimelate decarboxylase [Candidatus Aminicenantes bacterium]